MIYNKEWLWKFTFEDIRKIMEWNYGCTIPESEYLMLQELAKEVLMISKNENDFNEVALNRLGAS